MLEIFVCFASDARTSAHSLIARLGHLDLVRVTPEECEAQGLPEACQAGADADGVVLLLSPLAVPAQPNRHAWACVLDRLERSQSPAVASILVEPCRYPAMLGARGLLLPVAEAGRSLQRWAIGLGAGVEAAGFDVAGPRWFDPQPLLLAELWARLVDSPGRVGLHGPPGSGKTALSQQFAYETSAHFREVIWIACAGRSESQLLAEAAQALDGRRVLAIFDDWPPTLGLPASTRESVLITAGESTAADSVLLAPRSTRPSVLPANDEAVRRLWSAVSACYTHCVERAFASDIAGLTPDTSLAAAEALRSGACLEFLDLRGDRLRVTPEARRLLDKTGACRRRHAETLLGRLAGPHAPDHDATARLELAAALDWAFEADWSMAARLVWQAKLVLRDKWPVETAEFIMRLRRSAALHKVRAWVELCDRELSWMGLSAGEALGQEKSRDQQMTLDL